MIIHKCTVCIFYRIVPEQGHKKNNLTYSHLRAMGDLEWPVGQDACL